MNLTEFSTCVFRTLQEEEEEIKRVILVFYLVVAIFTVGAQTDTSPLKLSSPRMNGPEVKAVQEKLLDLGFSNLGDADGWFGPVTKDAVSKFQQFYGFLDNGIVDSLVWKALMLDFQKQTEIEATIRKVNSVSSLKFEKQSRDIMGRSTEGGSVDRLFSEGSLLIEDFFFYGEMGKSEYRVFHLGTDLVILQKEYQYSEPFGVKNATIKNTSHFFLKKNSFMLENGITKKSRLEDLVIHDLIGGKDA